MNIHQTVVQDHLQYQHSFTVPFVVRLSPQCPPISLLQTFQPHQIYPYLPSRTAYTSCLELQRTCSQLQRTCSRPGKLFTHMAFQILQHQKSCCLQYQCSHCKRCISYSNSVHPSACPSVRHTRYNEATDGRINFKLGGNCHREVHIT